MDLTLVFALGLGSVTVTVGLAGLVLRHKKPKPTQPTPAPLNRAAEDPFLDTGWLTEALTSLGDPARLEEPSPCRWFISSLTQAPALALELEASLEDDRPSQLRIKLTRAMPPHAATWQWDSADEQRCCVTLHKRALRGPEPLIFSEHPMISQAFRSLLGRAQLTRVQLTDRPNAQLIEATATFVEPLAEELKRMIHELSMALKFIPQDACDESVLWVRLARHPLALLDDRERCRRALDHLDALTRAEHRASILAAWTSYHEPAFWLGVFEQLSDWEPQATLSSARIHEIFDAWQTQGLCSDLGLGQLAARALPLDALSSYEGASWHEDWLEALIQQSMTKLGRSRTTNPSAPACAHIEQLVRAESIWISQWPSHRMPDGAHEGSALHTLRAKLYEGLSSDEVKTCAKTLSLMATTHFLLASDLLLSFSRSLGEHHITEFEELLNGVLATLKAWYSEHASLEIYDAAQRRVWEDLLLDHAQSWMGWEPLLCEVLGKVGDLDTLKAMVQAHSEEYGVKARPTPAMYELARRLQDRTGTFYECLAPPTMGALSMSHISGGLSRISGSFSSAKKPS